MKHLNRLHYFLTLPFLLGIFSSGCTNNNAKSNVVVLKVANETLTAQEFSDLLTKKIRIYDAAPAKNPSNVKRAKDEIIKSFIFTSIIKTYAAKKGIAVSTSEFDEAFSNIRKNYPNDLAFRESLASKDLLFEEWKKSFIFSLLEKKVYSEVISTFEIKKSPEDLDEAKKVYSSHLSEYQHPPEAHIFQIFLKKQEEAEKIHKMIKSGTHSFEDLAKKYSQSPDAKDGGDIGFLAKGVVPAFDSAFNLNVGQLSSVIKSTYGYHIVKITQKKPATKTTFEQAKETLLKRIYQDKLQSAFDLWLDEKIKTVKVEKDSQLIENMVVKTEGP